MRPIVAEACRTADWLDYVHASLRAMRSERMEMDARPLLIAAFALALAACASTTLRDSWYDMSYAGGPFRKILVLGVSSNVTERRIFEDVMAQRLAASGVEAIPAYRYLVDDGMAAEPALDAAVRASRADGLLMSRVRGIDRRTSVTTAMAPMHAHGFGWYGLYSAWYPVTDVRQYDIATVETSLFAADGKRVVWSGMTETYEPTSVAKDAPGFAAVIVKALQERGFLPVPK